MAAQNRAKVLDPIMRFYAAAITIDFLLLYDVGSTKLTSSRTWRMSVFFIWSSLYISLTLIAMKIFEECLRVDCLRSQSQRVGNYPNREMTIASICNGLSPH
ncbi:hypothetical protein NPIL_115571 [Nephila pilipes]|uniref:Uncharacterized protein n=1 Tax=Nephila pilipes TaxID=299642 RepID=A0A8X6UJE2_NEPPI|nr:hypothetical protein NPIL_115571 [Nephila pilipes]